MNFKRNCLNIITLIGSALLVAGCKDGKAFKQFEFLDPIKDLKQEVDDHEDKEFNGYVKYGNYDDYTAKGSDNGPRNLGKTYDVMYKYFRQHIMHTTGDRKILVIPVEFEDFTLEDLGVEKEDYLNNLKKAFFGYAKNNKFISVSEYYNRSSYGQLRLSGTVCDKFYKFPIATDTLIKEAEKYDDEVVRARYTEIITWVKSAYPNLDLNEYRINPEDNNSEVCIYCVYTYPTELKSNPKVFWNYTFFDKPFSWSSYSCLNTLSSAPDAHTLIHETGHLLGLSDYYPSNETDPDPTGRIDMMDCSVGDHSGFSKMILDWARPYYVTDSCEINIRSLSEYGDLILINDNWDKLGTTNKAKKTVFDEYYLIELYSPLGINYFDSSIGNNKAKLPLLPGIKIYHVDARIAYFESSVDGKTKTFLHYCDQTVQPGHAKDPTSGNVGLAHNNSATSTIVAQPTFNLYELQLNKVKGIADACAADENLFHSGDTFTIDSTKWNSENSSGNYKITVTGLNYKNATIKIDRI